MSPLTNPDVPARADRSADAPASPAPNPWAAFDGSAAKGTMARVLCLDDFEPLARRRLPRPVFGYVAGAAETGCSERRNRSAFGDWSLLPRVLQDVSRRDAGIDLFGTRYAAPFGIAPMGILGLSAYRGDAAMARAAAHQQIPFVLSGSSLMALEEIVEQAPQSWFQAYLPGDAARIEALVGRVQRAGVKVLVVTVDIPVAGNRENNIRAGFSTPLRPSLRLAWDGIVRPRWLFGTLLRTLLRHGMPHFENSFAERGAPILSSRVQRDFSGREHLNWSHLERIRRQWPGPLVVKGVLHPQDAAQARRLGIDGLIVSNHGGRQLDGAPSAIEMLPDVLEESGAMCVMVDGGVRRGTDVIKALALGARCAWVGRPFNHALAVGGEAGVAHAIALLRAEIDRNLAMLGVCGCTQLDRSVLRPTNAAAKALGRTTASDAAP